MKFSAAILGLSAFSQIAYAATWTLQTDYSGADAFDKFNFFSGSDPTHGFVQYQIAADAISQDLAYANHDNSFVIRANNRSVTPNGRPSVRLESKTLYDSGLFIFDAKHMPAGYGTWPAYWLVGSSWPFDGEVDIIEGVNTHSANSCALHTGAGCTMSDSKRVMAGETSYDSCFVNATGQPPNTGCIVKGSDDNSYGVIFNSNGDGVYAMSWTEESGFRIRFFPRESIFHDIKSGKPTPENWGNPITDYPVGANCSSNSFSQLKIVINLNFFGDWAGLPSALGVNTPHAFEESYWDINYLKVYQQY